MLNKLYSYKFEFFLITQIAILFGSLLVPATIFEFLSPILFFINILAGSLFLGGHQKHRNWIIVIVLFIAGGVFLLSEFDKSDNQVIKYLTIGILFLFHIVVTYKIITEIWMAQVVNKTVIFGLISGFISLGLIGFFICLSIEVIDPNSFSGMNLQDSNAITERLMYFSYITLLTIGYGDILPVTNLAQKATILIGLIGQFYLVIITGIVVGKFINHLK
jgi:hypothetical protein